MLGSQLLGLRTVVIKTRDVAKTKAFYRELLGVSAHFDQPFYVGFQAGAQELGIQPAAPDEQYKAIPYWGVRDISVAADILRKRSVSVKSDITDVGEGILLSSYTDPYGNEFGLIQNPNFTLQKAHPDLLRGYISQHQSRGLCLPAVGRRSCGNVQGVFSMILTCPTDKLTDVRDWYAEIFGQPSFDQPFYVGFNIDGYEFGLHPKEGREWGIIPYFGVANVHASHLKLTRKATDAHSVTKINSVGEGIELGTVACTSNPEGEVGLIQNPKFCLSNAARADLDELDGKLASTVSVAATRRKRKKPEPSDKDKHQAREDHRDSKRLAKKK